MRIDSISTVKALPLTCVRLAPGLVSRDFTQPKHVWRVEIKLAVLAGGRVHEKVRYVKSGENAVRRSSPLDWRPERLVSAA